MDIKKNESKKEELINDIVSLFSNPFYNELPSSIRIIFEDIHINRNHWRIRDLNSNSYEMFFELLVENGLLIETEYKVENNFEFTKFIPTNKFDKVWIQLCKEIEKSLLQHIPFKAYLEKYAEDNNLEINIVKKEFIEQFQNKNDDNELFKLMLELAIFIKDENEYKIIYDTKDRWFNNFINWLNN